MYSLNIKFLPRLALAAGLALALTACGGKKDGAATDLPKNEAIAAVPPPAGKMWSDIVAPTADGGMRMGNPDAPIKLMEYGSLSCPHCAKLAQDGMATLVSKYVDSGRVSYEFRSFAIHGVLDMPLTVLVRCDSPDAFFPLVEQIFSNYDSIIKTAEANNDKAQAASKLPPNQRWVAMADAFGLTDFFAARGLPVNQAHACLAKADDAQKVADQTDQWSKQGIDHTPTLFMNGHQTELETWAQLEPALQNAGAR